MYTKRYVRALWLAALLALLVGIPASCVAPATGTPVGVLTAVPTVVSPEAGTAIVQTPGTPVATAQPTGAPAMTGTAIPTAVSPAAGTVTAAPATTAATTGTAAPTTPAALTATTTATPQVTATPALTATPTCCIGERCVVDGVALTVRSVTMTSEGAQGVGTPQPDQRLVLADVTIENVGNQPVEFRPDLFRLVAEDGAEFTARTITPDQSGNPGPGEVVLLRVVFEVPKTAGDFALVYAPPSLGGREIRVDL